MKKLNKSKFKNFNRREFLCNTAGGVAAASMVSAFAQRALAQENIKRFIVWYVPEGCAQQAFWPVKNPGDFIIKDASQYQEFKDENGNANSLIPASGTDPVETLKDKFFDERMAGYCLTPLKEHEGDFSLYGGFQNRYFGGDDHKNAVSGALTGGKQDEGSIDQIVGNHEAFKSVVSSIYLPIWGHHVNSGSPSSDYLSPIRSKGGVMPGNWNPMEVHNELWPINKRIPGPMPSGDAITYGAFNARLDALRAVEQRLAAIKCIGGEEARHRMEVLLQSFQQVETSTQSILDAEKNAAQSGIDVTGDIPDGWPQDTQGSGRSKYWNNSDYFEKLVDVSIDITVAALALDRTRVSAMQFSGSGNEGNDIDTQHYRKVASLQNILEPGSVNDHYLGHSGEGDDRRRRNQARVFRWYYSKLARLIQRLKDIPDGNGQRMFDNTLILVASEFGSHDHRYGNIPYMIFGGDNVNFTKGQYISAFNTAGSGHRNGADLMYGITNSLGLNRDHFGVSTTPFSI